MSIWQIGIFLTIIFTPTTYRLLRPRSALHAHDQKPIVIIDLKTIAWIAYFLGLSQYYFPLLRSGVGGAQIFIDCIIWNGVHLGELSDKPAQLTEFPLQ